MLVKDLDDFIEAGLSELIDNPGCILIVVFALVEVVLLQLQRLPLPGECVELGNHDCRQCGINAAWLDGRGEDSAWYWIC